MIVKTKDQKQTGSKFEQAGDAAEEQMAFYLRRAFADSPDVLVFNDLRLVDGDDAAQIDHLVLHAYGMFIVESKSISGEVTVNEKDEWIRKWGNRRAGMPSPIQQGKRQAEFLRKLLNENSEQLRDKYVFGMIQGRFGYCPIGIYVAISDQGVINRDADFPEVRKADKVCEGIAAEIERHRKGASIINRLRNSGDDYGLYQFRPGEIERIKNFVLSKHSPVSVTRDAKAKAPPGPSAATAVRAAPSPDSPQPPAQAMEGAACKHCGSAKLQAAYGQYGYYFKCTACGKNTPMNFKCCSCGAKARIRKQGPRFDRVCGCGAESMVWMNQD